MKTINIKGKEYVEVNERLKEFRSNPAFAGYSLETSIVSMQGEIVTMQAVIKDASGRTIATGFASEEKGASMINKTSYIENCETSAWGRALGNLGIGIDTAVCSAQELLMALQAQSTKTKEKVPQTEEKSPKTESGDFDRAEKLAAANKATNKHFNTYLFGDEDGCAENWQKIETAAKKYSFKWNKESRKWE